MTVRELSRRDGKSIILHRWLGAWIDFAVFWIILVLAELLLGSELYQRTVWLWVLVAMSYFVVLEALTGQTLGKKIAGLKVVDEAGQTPNWVQAIKRTLTRILEVNPVGGGLLAALIVVLTKDRQRLGDLWANTFVVRVDALEKARAEQVPAAVSVG